jgi:uncharacterized protein (DUF2141 family)
VRLSLVLFMVTLIFSLGYTQTEDRSKLSVIISGLKNNNGDVRLALLNSQEAYQGKKPAIAGLVSGIENKIATFKIEKLVYGEYAIKVFHDEDQDGELGKNFLGMPTESYGFSNNARGSFGPPDYDEAKFVINQKEMEITIIVK